ncbi:uncharacterized protein LOC131147686 isoform X2 [Malania oleifera]|uniref:uncharacterized protein LOC131147686 isoform X2 n=1 Tax=Malania oleifera TaxID=397392 RepID=UPI0025ADC346|nr:uncharacterized protein LOC131147686 isoform X2 [Malania oleifera]XP_057953188.1 uncharacterized protein LOC131147686 isoform X2 [Malania oleifera]XP_057953189.1 uncharacterized protein LOC131147686 isoform X2 [Malania oleifera]
MDGKKEVGSSSSFPPELFGPNPKESPPPSSSSGLFTSIFPPPSEMVGRKSSSSEVTGSWQKQTWDYEMEHGKQATPGNGLPDKGQHSIFQEHRVEPCHLSSSLYYGGQDIYSHSPSTHDSGSQSIYKKDEGEDDPNGNNSNYACRGNWWQGSLYY